MIFINYRIKDSIDLVTLLHEHLVRDFGEENVFWDKHNLEAGRWNSQLEAAVRRCSVMLSIIGPDWHKVAFPDGHPKTGFPRLSDPEDWVRKEITLALSLHNEGHRVIPVLLQGRYLPSREWLANVGLGDLWNCQPCPLHSAPDYKADYAKLRDFILQAAPTLRLKSQIDQALSGVRPRLHPFTPPRMFPAAASKLFGREEVGEQLLALLRRHRRVALTGDGGLGKTAMAAAVLRELAQARDQKWFVGGLFLHDFYQQPTFAAFVQTILVHAGQSGQTAEEQIALAAEVLKRSGTFLYLEGAEKLVELSAVLRLLDDQTQLLMTTREPRQADGMKRLTLQTIELDQAAQAIRFYANQSRDENGHAPLSIAADDAGWHDLARDMGGHALGCKLAGELCGVLAQPPAALHAALAEEGLKILAAGDSSKENLNVLFRQSALAFCAEGSPEPCAALRAWQSLTFAGTSLVPRSVLRELGVDRDEGLRGLVRGGLATSELLPADNAGETEPAYALGHALLAEWGRTGLEEFGMPQAEFLAKARTWGNTVSGVMQRNHCVPGGPNRYELLAPLAEGLLREVQRTSDLAPAERYTFFYLPARMHHLHANFLAAEPLYREALAEMEATAGLDAVETATAQSNLAHLLKHTNRLVEAEPLMRRALAIDERVFGAEHPRVAIRLNNLAQLLQETNRLAEAEPLMRRALAIDEKSYGAAHPSVARDLNNLAGLLKGTNHLGEAEPLMRRALAIVEQSIGDEHPYVAYCLNNLAQLLKATNRLAEAEPLMRRALAIDEKSYGAENPSVARNLDNLALLLKDTNRLAEAEPLMRRALVIDEQSYGAKHPNVASCLNNLARLLQDTNRLAEAEPLIRRALTIDEQSYGAEHPSVARDLNNLAQLLQATNRLADAEPLMRRALTIHERSFGAEHPNVAVASGNLAALYYSTNRLAEAEPLMRRALTIHEQSYGAEHPSVAVDLNNLAQLLQATSRLAEAEPLIRRALTIDEQSYGAEHPRVAINLSNLALLLRATNRLAEAEPLMRRALVIDEQSYGAKHPNVASCLNNLARLLQDTNRLTEAEPLMTRAMTIFVDSLGAEHPSSQTAAENYRLLLQEIKLPPGEIEAKLHSAK